MYVFDFNKYARQRMFKPFKFWADYHDQETELWTNGLDDDPYEDRITTRKRLQIYTEAIRTNLKAMTTYEKKQESERKKSLEEIIKDVSPSGSASPTSPFARMVSPKCRNIMRRPSLRKKSY